MQTQALEPHEMTGLSSAEARDRLRRFGSNEIAPPRPDPWIVRFTSNLREPMSLLLIGAATIAGLGLGERLDAVVILAIVVVNASIATMQEGKAGRALEALRSLETPVALVIRDGRRALVRAAELVPGDVVVLATGARVPADIRLLETESMEVDESLLTGESLPVPKDARADSAPDAPLGERGSNAFSATVVTRGSGLGMVTATGLETELGGIAAHLRDRQPPTPLQIELQHLTGRLGLAAVVVAATVLLLILLTIGFSAEGLERGLLTAVALAVAAVPEGLASVVTVALALGVRRMATEGAIIRRLPAVETLGSTDVILTDKTGTLTENRMRIDRILTVEGEELAIDSPDALPRSVVEVAILCNDASLDPVAGDPLEVALLEMAGNSAVSSISARWNRVASAPFDSERKRMSTLCRGEDGLNLFVKGAPESVLEQCVMAWATTESHVLTDELRKEVESRVELLAERGMRVLALAGRKLDAIPRDVELAERDLTLVGLVALHDPLRAEAADAVLKATNAGIQILMVTGDHPNTAVSIARDAGIAGRLESVLTGRDIATSGMPLDPTSVVVYARVNPDDKLALVDRLRATDHVVAVTGDGVNDAPALRRADIGVAMGRGGTDAAREASDMVITDDNLATIVTAIREGRGIYDNIRKVVDYLVAANLSEILVVVGCLILFPELGVPLLPIQLLWINLLTDGLPALALGVDPIDPGIMERPPRPRSQRLLTLRVARNLFASAVVLASAAITSLLVLRFAWNGSWGEARTIMFTVLALSQLFYAFVVHGPSGSTSRNRGTNGWLWLGIATGLLLQVAVVSTSVAHDVFETTFLAPREWVLAIVASLVAAAGTLMVGKRFGPTNGPGK